VGKSPLEITNRVTKENDVGALDKYRESMRFTKTKVRTPELTPRQMVEEEIRNQRLLLKGQKPTKKTTSWWDQKSDCVTVSVRGASYFNDANNTGRMFGDDIFGKGKKWTKAEVSKFIDRFETDMYADELVNDTKFWFKRYQAKIAGSKTRKKTPVRGKATVTKKK
jgi:hypothetical protein